MTKQHGLHEQPDVTTEWEAICASLVNRVERRCWSVAAVAVAFSLAQFLAPRLWPEPPKERVVATTVDAITGDTKVSDFVKGPKDIPAKEAQDVKNAMAFVRAREGYDWMFLKRDHSTVKRMSTVAVFREHDKQFDGENALDKVWSDSQLHCIDVISARPTGKAPDGSAEMVVNYEKVVTFKNQGMRPQVTRHVATLHYTYEPEVAMKPEDRAENPFGFVVTAYRSDTELTAKAAPPLNRDCRIVNPAAAEALALGAPR
jgi:type IV secretion system protein VirB8